MRLRMTRRMCSLRMLSLRMLCLRMTLWMRRRLWPVHRMHLRLRMICRGMIDRAMRCRRMIHTRCRPVHRRRRMRSTRMRNAAGVRRMIGRRPGHRRSCRTTMIHRSQLGPVTPGSLLMLDLRCRSLDMPIPRRHLFLGIRPGIDTAGTTIIADPVLRRIVDHRPVDISIVNDGRIDTGHGRIVPEMTTNPSAAIITGTTITIAIINPAIKSDMGPPVPGMPAIQPAGITPVTRRP